MENYICPRVYNVMSLVYLIVQKERVVRSKVLRGGTIEWSSSKTQAMIVAMEQGKTWNITSKRQRLKFAIEVSTHKGTLLTLKLSPGSRHNDYII